MEVEGTLIEIVEVKRSGRKLPVEGRSVKGIPLEKAGSLSDLLFCWIGCIFAETVRPKPDTGGLSCWNFR